MDLEPPVTVTLADGGRILIRPLLPTDRDELAEAYDQLSAQSRYRRFFSPPRRLSQSFLDYLTELDHQTRHALVATDLDQPGTPGVAVARWITDRDDPTCADAAVTVVDAHQHRGIATQLLAHLVTAAMARGITVFTGDVLWENTPVIESLRARGARIGRSEPGTARVELDLPAPDRLTESAVHWLLVEAARAEGGVSASE